MIPQASSSYDIEPTCQIENFGYLLEQLPKPFGIFDPDYRGRFVEVGSFDGKTYSNVWQFVKAGWQGIMIEPMADNVTLLRENLATIHDHRVTWVPLACSDKPGMVQMFFEREGSREAKPGELTHQIQAERLDDILARHYWKTNCDMLVIDTEDYEQPVLRGFDLAFWRPKLCIVETHGHQREIIHGIFDPLYRIFYEDGLNTMFVRRDWCQG